MKVTLEASDPAREFRRVVLENKDDDVSVEKALRLVIDAVIAWGYHPDCIKEIVPDYDELW